MKTEVKIDGNLAVDQFTQNPLLIGGFILLIIILGLVFIYFYMKQKKGEGDSINIKLRDIDSNGGPVVIGKGNKS